MAQFVLLIYGNGYMNALRMAAEKHPDIILYRPIRNRLLQALFHLHNAWPLNKRFELPLKKIWFKSCIDERKINGQSLYFIFYESFHLAYSKQYLIYLKEKYPNAKFCFCFTNPVSAYQLNKLQTVKKYYHAMLTFFSEDAQKYNFLYYGMNVYTKIDVPSSDLPESDLFFIGRNKGRLPLLLEVYKKLSSYGLTCDFYITDVDEKDCVSLPGIVYNQELSYEQVLQHVEKTRCILEVLQNGNDYCSIRTFEACTYKKKLLTTNKKIFDFAYYNPNIMKSFVTAQDIDVAFLLQKTDPAEFRDIDASSCNSYLDFICNHVQ